MRYCQHCKRMVRAVKKIGTFSWLMIVVTSGATMGILLFFWIPWFVVIKKAECQICGATDLLKTAPAESA
jgi:hypothetical protein